MKNVTITAALLCVTLFVPLSLFSQVRTDFSGQGSEQLVVRGDYVLRGTVLVQYQGKAQHVTIPADLGITEIGDNAFLYSEILSITIPEGVQRIGDFGDCYRLITVRLPESLRVIGDRTFAYCWNLTSITIPVGVTSIGDMAFYECMSLTSIAIPAGVTSIGYQAFAGCSSLTSITIPSSVTYIGYSAFIDTAWLDRQPDGLVYAGKVLYAYKGEMPAGTVINNIRADTAAIASGAFRWCTDITGITIPAGVIAIGNQAFNGCSSLASVTIPAGVTSIEALAFYKCESLTNIAIPAGVTFIGYQAFHDTAWLDSQPDGLVYAGKVLYTYKGTMPANTVINNIRTDTTAIADSAFSRSYNLASITIPASVTSIGYAFNGCNSLTSIIVDNQNSTFSSVDGVLFDKNRTALITYPQGKQGSYTIPAGVTSIGDSAFSGCMSLTSVTIPAGVTSIGDSAFSGCHRLTSVTIPAGVTSIGNSSFYECRSLTSVTIPAGVTSIGNSSFYGCSSLAGITIPAGITDIGYRAFLGCRSLASVTIPAGVIIIGNEAFFSCRSLTSVTIPSSVTSIGKHAFYGCSSLASITIPAGIAFIGYEAFSSTAWLDRQPDGLVYAGKMLYMYKGTMPANTVINNIRADTVAIVDYAFLKYTGLTSVTIPAGVTFIGNNVFSGCTGLTSITIPANIALGANVTDNGFNVVYNGNGKQAGTYISRFNRWFRGTATISVPASTDIAPGTVLEAALEGDVELFYRVTVPSNDLLLTITLSGSYPSITLYDGIGRCIAFDYYDSVYDNNAKISRNVSAGIYYIKVSVYSYYNDSTVPFTLHVLTETAR